jgi:signal transduction histidine kinase
MLDGKVVRRSAEMLVNVGDDIEKELSETVEAERSQRLASMSPVEVVAELKAEFNSYMAINHDYVKVAAGIRANLERLKSQFPQIAGRPEALAIEGAARRLEDLPSLHQLLLHPEVAHEWPDRTNHRVLATLDSYYFYLQPMASERSVVLQRPTCRQGESRSTVYGSRRVLGGVVLQLMDNAINYAQAGESVSVVVDEPVGSDDVSIVCKSPGPPILPDEQDLIFQPFYRGKMARSVRDGGGVGLAIVKTAVAALGGSVRASQHGSGGRRTTTFVVTLPRSG